MTEFMMNVIRKSNLFQAISLVMFITFMKLYIVFFFISNVQLMIIIDTQYSK